MAIHRALVMLLHACSMCIHITLYILVHVYILTQKIIKHNHNRQFAFLLESGGDCQVMIKVFPQLDSPVVISDTFTLMQQNLYLAVS